MADRRYTREEVDAILGRALSANKDDAGGMSHDELVAAAREVGVEPGAIERAAHEVMEGRRLEQEVADYKRRQWKGFVSHLASYVLVIAFLVFVNFMTASTLWVLWPAAGWGLGLAFHLLGLLTMDPEKVRRKVERRAERRREHERRDRQRRELEAGARELGVAVTKGLTSIIGALEEGAAPAAKAPEKAETPAPHVRVEPAKDKAKDRDAEAEQRAREVAEAEAELEEELRQLRARKNG